MVAAATVARNEQPLIVSAIGPNYTILAATAVRLHTAADGDSKWTLVATGVMALCVQSKEQGHVAHFRLVSLPHHDHAMDTAGHSQASEGGTVVWRQQIYKDMQYDAALPYFHTFEANNETLYGFLFAHEGEASRFAQTLAQLTRKRKSRGFFSTLFGRSRKSSSSACATQDSSELWSAGDVSDPMGFEHQSHIGFNKQTGTFDVSNIPDEWKSVFRKADIGEDQLRNKDTALFIAEFVRKTGNQQTRELAKKKAPPPPPKKPLKAPNPPPKPTASKPSFNQPGSSTLQNEALKNDSANTPSVTNAPGKNEAIDPEGGPSNAGKESGANPARSLLLESIRSSGKSVLRPVAQSQNSISAASESNETCTTSGDDQGDLMAAMLTKALASRNRRMAHSDSD